MGEIKVKTKPKWTMGSPFSTPVSNRSMAGGKVFFVKVNLLSEMRKDSETFSTLNSGHLTFGNFPSSSKTLVLGYRTCKGYKCSSRVKWILYDHVN